MDNQQEQRYGSYLHTLLEVLPMVRWIFQSGYKPEREHFSELPQDYAEKAKAFMGGTKCNLFYASSGQLSVRENESEMALLTENQLGDLFEADAMIERYAAQSEQELTTYEDKLRFAAGLMPPEISQGTKFGRGSCT